MTSEAMKEIAYMRQSLEELKNKIPAEQYKEHTAYVNKRIKELEGAVNG